MIGLILKSPLAESDIALIVLEVSNHISEVLLLQFVQFLEAFSRGDVDVVLSLRLWCFEGTSEDGDSSIDDFLGHLRVREVLVNQDAFDELGVFNTASSFLLDLDQVQIDILPLQVSDCEHCLHCDLC